MALRWRQGNQQGGLFPRLLLGLSAKMNLDRDGFANQLLSSDLIFLSNSSNAAPAAIASSPTKKAGGTPTLSHRLRKFTAGLDPVEKSAEAPISFPSEAG
jgi:hypothetical protein